jgi:hypothetical protein
VFTCLLVLRVGRQITHLPIEKGWVLHRLIATRYPPRPNSNHCLGNDNLHMGLLGCKSLTMGRKTNYRFVTEALFLAAHATTTTGVSDFSDSEQFLYCTLLCVLTIIH